MNQSNLVDVVAAKTNMKKKDAEAAVEAVFEAISEELVDGGKVLIAGFGSFKVKERAQRVGLNPKTLKKINIPATKTASFTPGKALKDELAK